ncbi:hypothetical protein EYF80_035907 [Liparis tanakae]|uniref:Uncharacterized protein n=1 Tax=Liparis tanakae TaxID=230148 RepID=A0A4Z2GK59_9TELE|nr:hypothetical protein EYF80_035907 [Liparis tanakae]
MRAARQRCARLCRAAPITHIPRAHRPVVRLRAANGTRLTVDFPPASVQKTLRRRSPWPQVCEQADHGPICHIGHGASPQGRMSTGFRAQSHRPDRKPEPSWHSTFRLDQPEPQLLEHWDHSPSAQSGPPNGRITCEDADGPFLSLDLLKKVYLTLGGLASPAVASSWMVMTSRSRLKLWILSSVVAEPLYFSTAPRTGRYCSIVDTEKFPLRM